MSGTRGSYMLYIVQRIYYMNFHVIEELQDSESKDLGSNFGFISY